MIEKDYISDIEGAERRFFASPVKIEIREQESAGSNTIEGVAAVVSVTTDMGWYEEVIAPGAFDEVLNDDIRCLFNHDPNQILARSNNGAGTLQVFLTPEGHLAYRYETPKRSYAVDLEDAVNLGDVDKSSFAFRVKSQTWDYGDEELGTKDKRTINSFEKLYDVSPVTYPAYQDTSVAKRSLQGSKPIEKKSSIAGKSRHLKMLKNKVEL